MTARIGYLAALASGRRDGPLLQPPRRLFPPVALADAELAVQQGPADPGSGSLPPGAPGGISAPTVTALAAREGPAAAAAGQRSKASGVIDPGTADQAPAEATGQPHRAEATGQPERVSVTPRFATNGVPVTGSDVSHVRNAVDVTAELRGQPGPAATRTFSGARLGASSADGFDADPAGAPARVPPAAEGTPSPFRTHDRPVTPHGISTGAAPGQAGKESAGSDPPRGKPVLYAAAGQRAAGEAPAAEAGVLGDHERLRDESAAVKHDRATTGAQDAAAVALERSSGPGAAAGRRMPVAAGDQVAVPRPAGDVAGMPLRRRQGDTGAAGTSPATLTIGTIEITVLPPQAQEPAHPGSPPPAPMPPAPVKSPDRLSRGLGPWFGWDQA